MGITTDNCNHVYWQVNIFVEIKYNNFFWEVIIFFLLQVPGSSSLLLADDMEPRSNGSWLQQRKSKPGTDRTLPHQKTNSFLRKGK